MTLTGYVFGWHATLSWESFNTLAGNGPQFDSGVLIPDADYEYPLEFSLFSSGPMSERWYPMIRDLFQVDEDFGDISHFPLVRKNLKPLPRALHAIFHSNVLPRKSDLMAIRKYEVPILHALTTGSPALSLRHVMMSVIWASRESRDGAAVVPYVRFLSEFLHKSGLLPGDMKRGDRQEIMTVPLRISGLQFSWQDKCIL